MSLCFYSNDTVCTNKKSPETFGKRCIEADNLLKNEQTYCRHHIEEAEPDEVLSNEICLYLFDGKCANALCLQHGKSCPRNSGESCVFFIPEHKFRKKNDHETVKSDQTDIISHPSHYTDGRKYEPKDVIRDWNLNFNLGSAVKYISRAGRKDDIIQDLKKAKQFIDFEIDALMEEQEKTE